METAPSAVTDQDTRRFTRDGDIGLALTEVLPASIAGAIAGTCTGKGEAAAATHANLHSTTKTRWKGCRYDMVRKKIKFSCESII